MFVCREGGDERSRRGSQRKSELSCIQVWHEMISKRSQRREGEKKATDGGEEFIIGGAP